MIQARLRKSFPARDSAPAFRFEAEFSVGAVAVVFGPPASGKTLLLDLIAGLARPEEGRLLLDDQILYDQASGIHLPPARRPVACVFSNPGLLPHLTLRRNLLFAASCRRLPKLERHRKVDETLERLRLTSCADRTPLHLTPGERLRGALACALVLSPRLLLIDEPEGGDLLRADLLGFLAEIRTAGSPAFLYATRRLEDCLELGADMLVLDNGRLLQSGPCREVLEAPSDPGVARLLGGFNLLPATITALDPAGGSSRLKWENFELSGPYFPGQLRGDRVTLCVRCEDLRALPASGKPGPNHVPAQLMRVTDGRRSTRLHFSGGIVVEASSDFYRQYAHVRNWWIEFPQDSLRVL